MDPGGTVCNLGANSMAVWYEYPSSTCASGAGRQGLLSDIRLCLVCRRMILWHTLSNKWVPDTGRPSLPTSRADWASNVVSGAFRVRFREVRVMRALSLGRGWNARRRGSLPCRVPDTVTDTSRIWPLIRMQLAQPSEPRHQQAAVVLRGGSYDFVPAQGAWQSLG